MASVSSSAARSLIRDGKSAVNLLLRVRTANLTETVQNNGPAIRSLLRLNEKPARQYPVFPKIFPVTQTGFRVGVVQQEEDVSERIGKMEAAHGKRVVNNNEEVDTEEEEETDFDEDEIDDIDIDDDDEEFEDIDEDDEDEEEEKDPKYTRKKK
ncbi:PREDICTED: phosphopantothenoylcysteine decarboxylase subunit VHS3 [Camelina sativa]|uniref:Phosphopantothenoylcysteine decarboxylase subunit VHS3 n=1 Tax=Camelina sativa TaxID=90675 RepID=A0ABM0W4B7_CAMSA|nr:PREDICTED: phosphopantothenoylcysteine decarboxylase subunit VHS3 [Camelina sativa]